VTVFSLPPPAAMRLPDSDANGAVGAAGINATTIAGHDEREDGSPVAFETAHRSASRIAAAGERQRPKPARKRRGSFPLRIANRNEL